MRNLLIFDLDGTLVDCKQLHRDAFLQAIDNRYYPEERVEGLPTTKKIEILNDMGYELDPDWVATKKKQLTFELFDAHISYNPELLHQFLISNNIELIKKFKFPFTTWEDRLYVNKSFN